jgi:hypothetical protein
VILRRGRPRQCYLDRLEQDRESYGFKAYAYVLLIGTGRVALLKKLLPPLASQIKRSCQLSSARTFQFVLSFMTSALNDSCCIS